MRFKIIKWIKSIDFLELYYFLRSSYLVRIAMMSRDSIFLFVYCCISCEKAIKSRNSIFFDKIYSPFVFIPLINRSMVLQSNKEVASRALEKLCLVVENLKCLRLVWKGWRLGHCCSFGALLLNMFKPKCQGWASLLCNKRINCINSLYPSSFHHVIKSRESEYRQFIISLFALTVFYCTWILQ